MTQDEADFWRYCRAFLAAPAAAELCRDLQDRFGVDSSLLMFMLWRGTQGGSVAAAEMDRALAVAAHWRSRVVAPLQQVFQHLHHPPPGFIGADALRHSVQRAQAEAERLEQAALAGLVAGLTDGARGGSADAAAMRANLDAYLARLGIGAGEGAGEGDRNGPADDVRAALVAAGLAAAM